MNFRGGIMLRAAALIISAVVLLAAASAASAAAPQAIRTHAVAPKPDYQWNSYIAPPATAICIHFPPSMPLWKAELLINYAKDLGAQYIRFDVRWNVVEPKKGVFNMTALARYKHIIEYMESLGIYPIVIVGTGIPGWASGLLSSNLIVHQDEFLKYAQEYAAKVSKYLGYEVFYYQLGNELNHLNHALFYLNGLAAKYIAALGKGVGEGNPYYIGIVNVFADIIGWTNTLESWIKASGKYFDIIAIDHYPGTWSPTSFSDWSPLTQLINIADKYGKIPAIMETGYSTWFPWFPIYANEQNQVKYINQAFPAILNIAQKHYVAFLSWYELIDEPQASGLPEEKHFGVLHADLTKKPAYNTLKEWFHEIDNFQSPYVAYGGRLPVAEGVPG